jgi:hypothetical protein
MADKKTDKTVESTFKPASALDCINNENFTESKISMDFRNDSKNINDINTTYSHSALDVCAAMI